MPWSILILFPKLPDFWFIYLSLLFLLVSGTVNPTLQDNSGRPKRSLGTIVHILNDLLGVAPRGKVHVDSVCSGDNQSENTMASDKTRSHRIQRPTGIRPLSSSHVGSGDRPQNSKSLPPPQGMFIRVI